MSKVTNALKRSRARRAARERYLDAHPDVKVRSWYRSLRRAMEWMIAARIRGVGAYAMKTLNGEPTHSDLMGVTMNPPLYPMEER